MEAADRLTLGVATEVITPPLPVALAGYGDRTGVAETVHDDLEVRAIVATDAGTTVCVLALDLMAMSADWAGAIRTAVAAELDTPVSCVLTTTVHTHAAPSTLTGSDFLGWIVPTAWRPALVERCVVAARRARSGAVPVSLRFARIALDDTLSFNRRGHPYEPTIAVLTAEADDGSTVLTLFNAGVHAVVLGPRNLHVSADWVGVARRAVEERLGGRAVFVQGCEGDVDPHGRAWEGTTPKCFDAVEKVGLAFAAAVVDGVGGASPVTGPTAIVRHEVVPHDVAGAPLSALSGSSTLAVELVEWLVGGVRFVAVPGEGFAQLGERIVAARADDAVVIVGFAPHWLGYFPVPFEAGYEEGLSYGEPFVAALVAALEDVP